MKRFLLLTLSLLLVASFGGCFSLSQPLTPEARTAVLRVPDEYLRMIAVGTSAAVEGMVGWVEYMERTGGKTRKEEILETVRQMQNRYQTPEKHPLLGLSLLKFDGGDDNATVNLRKGSNGPEIKLELAWTGRGWLIVGDNLFGPKGVLQQTYQGK